MTNEINLMTAVEAAKYLNIPVKTLQTWRCTKRVKVPYCTRPRLVRAGVAGGATCDDNGYFE